MIKNSLTSLISKSANRNILLESIAQFVGICQGQVAKDVARGFAH